MNARRDTRTTIVLAAMELFWEKGYASTSVADILSRSQVNSGSASSRCSRAIAA